MELPNVTDSIILVIAVAKISLSVDEKYDSERLVNSLYLQDVNFKERKIYIHVGKVLNIVKNRD